MGKCILYSTMPVIHQNCMFIDFYYMQLPLRMCQFQCWFQCPMCREIWRMPAQIPYNVWVCTCYCTCVTKQRYKRTTLEWYSS